jgi:hypothetical protein
MRVLVQEIAIPAASTIAYGAGLDAADGRVVRFCGDYRPLADVQAALLETHAPLFALVEDWQVIGSEPVKGAEGNGKTL